MDSKTLVRGAITYRDRASQIRDYSGLRYGNITPTDIDGLIEYKDKAYVIIEYKYADADVPNGQIIALTRLCDDLQNYKHTILIIARHNSPIGKDIDGAQAVVEKYRWRKNWIVIKNITKELWSVKRLIDWFLNTNEVINSK